MKTKTVQLIGGGPYHGKPLKVDIGSVATLAIDVTIDGVKHCGMYAAPTDSKEIPAVHQRHWKWVE